MPAQSQGLAARVIEAAGIGDEKDTPLFRSVDRKTKELSTRRLDRQRAWAMVKRRTQQAGIATPGICNHTFRGTGITAYLENPEAKLEHAQQMAAHPDKPRGHFTLGKSSYQSQNLDRERRHARFRGGKSIL